MLTTLEGTYKNGKVELKESPPSEVGEAKVLVTFLPADDVPNAAGPAVRTGRIYYGMFKGAWRETTEKDFRAAEWHGDVVPEEPDADNTRR